MNALAKRFGDCDLLGDLWDHFLEEPLFAPSATLPRLTFGVDVYEKEDSWVIEAALPGTKKEDIQVNVDDGILEIKTEKKDEKKEKSAKYAVRELSYGACSRSFRLPRGIDRSSPSAELKDGILTLVFKKSEKDRIKIN